MISSSKFVEYEEHILVFYELLLIVELFQENIKEQVELIQGLSNIFDFLENNWPIFVYYIIPIRHDTQKLIPISSRFVVLVSYLKHIWNPHKM